MKKLCCVSNNRKSIAHHNMTQQIDKQSAAVFQDLVREKIYQSQLSARHFGPPLVADYMCASC